MVTHRGTPNDAGDSGQDDAQTKRSSRRAFIKAGAALTGGAILGVYAKPTIRSFAVDRVFASGSVPPPPPPPPTSYTTPLTIGYWKTHPSQWPVTVLSPFGCSTVSLSQSAALTALKQATSADMTKMLAAQLIAAKLNVLSGCDPSIRPVIDAADQFLCQHPVGSNPQGSDRTYAENLKDQLDAYNNGGTLTNDGWELDD